MAYILIDNHRCGIGDLLVNLWCVVSARHARAAAVRLNARDHEELALSFGVEPEELTCDERPREQPAEGAVGGPDGSGLEERLAHGRRQTSRFHAWCEHHGLPRLPPIRPPYRERPELGAWAETVWRETVWREREAHGGGGPRVLLFPRTKGGPLRDWPWSAWRRLAAMLRGADSTGGRYTVVADLPTRDARHRELGEVFEGHALPQMVALLARADLVVAGDSGPAHLGATLGVPTLALCGPTRAEIVFGHALDVVQGLAVDPASTPCVGCHFRADRGFAPGCGAGCTALARLTPDFVFEQIRAATAARRSSPVTHATTTGASHRHIIPSSRGATDAVPRNPVAS